MLTSSYAAYRMLNENQARLNSFWISDVQNDHLAWKPLDANFMKINFNVSFCLTSFIGGIGVVVRDWRGDFVYARSDQVFASSLLMAECMAVRLTLTITLDLGLSFLVLEGDSLEVINKLRNPSKDVPWIASSLVQDCLFIITSFISFNCKHVRRSANSVVDQIAHLGVSSSRCESWSSPPP